jgi:hypothetical protein
MFTQSARFCRSPTFIALGLFLISLFELVSLGRQFTQGFRPFLNEPVRVNFSWDMFATRVERCTMQWAPALNVPRPDFSSLRQLGSRYEWDIIYDHAEDYRMLARWVCSVGNSATRIKLHCFFPNGTESNDEIHCGS